MDSAKLSAFVTVAENRSFSAASIEMRLSQSTISTRVRELERELGQQLLSRTSRRVDLTEAGTAALPPARAALAQMALVTESVDAVAGIHRGTIRLGIVAGASHPRLPDLLSRFCARYPQIEITMSAAPSASLEQALERRELDLAYLVCADRSPLLRHWTVEPLCLAGTRGDRVPIDTLVRSRLVLLDSGADVRTRLERAAKAAGFTLDVAAQLADPALVLDMAESGLGNAVMPSAVCPSESAVLCDHLGRPVTVCAGLATPSGYRSPATELLFDALTALVDGQTHSPDA